MAATPLQLLVVSALLVGGISTQTVRGVQPYPALLYVTSFGSGVAFTACTAQFGCELYFFDGANAPYLVADINPGPAHSVPAGFTANGTVLYFSATRDDVGNELWMWNGTAVSLVADINSGPPSSFPNFICVVGNTLYYAAATAATGTELYASKPSVPAQASYIVKDILPGIGSSNPAFLTLLQGTIYMQALQDPVTIGTELYGYTPATDTFRLIVDIWQRERFLRPLHLLPARACVCLHRQPPLSPTPWPCLLLQRRQ